MTGITFDGAPDLSASTLEWRGLTWDDLTGVRWDIVLRDSSCESTIRLAEGQLEIRRPGGTDVVVPFDPVEHAWLQVRPGPSVLDWSTSPDGVVWTPLVSQTACDVSSTDIDFALSTTVMSGPDVEASFDAWRSCPSAG